MIWLSHFFRSLGCLFSPGNVKNSTSSIKPYLPRFLPSDLHPGTQHQCLFCLAIPNRRLADDFQHKPEVYMPALLLLRYTFFTSRLKTYINPKLFYLIHIQYNTTNWNMFECSFLFWNNGILKSSSVNLKKKLVAIKSIKHLLMC